MSEGLNNKEINEKQIKEIRSLLEHAKQPDIDEGRKRKTLELLQAERKRLHIRSKKTYGQRVWEQLPYISPAAWLLQGILLLMIGWGFYAEGREEILLYLLFCAPMAGVVGFTEIMRSYRQNMWELEQACRYNLRQLMGMRMILFGIADTLAACSVAVMGLGAGVQAWELVFFYFIPQILSDCVYLYLMARFRRRFQGTALLGSAVFMAFFWMKLLQGVPYNKQLMQRIAEPFALILILSASVGLLAWCCARFLKGMETECCEA